MNRCRQAALDIAVGIVLLAIACALIGALSGLVTR